jgi:Ppx/GppA phosphatase family/CHAD domain
VEKAMTKKNKVVTCAVIDMGSNSTEVLVAHCAPDHLDVVKDESTMTRLGESVKETGEIAPDKRDDALAVLRQYQELAKQCGADPILVVATEAMREARNRESIVEDIQRETELQVNIIEGTLEAAYTYHGAVYGAETPPGTGVLDVGGASTELVTARERLITWLISVPIGSGWLHDQYLSSNPPSQEEVEKAEDFLRTYIPGLHVPQPPPALIVTGSSAKALLKLAEQALKLDGQGEHLTRDDLLGCRGLLLSLPAEAIAQHYGQSIERARVLPGGVLLILAMMDYLHLNDIRISDHGVREGVLLAYARYGEHWLDHPEVKPGDERVGEVPPLPEKVQQARTPEGTFVESGRGELQKRAKKFLDWREKALKREEVEDVHKMRVASRRLRATMDAYEPACKAKPFKQAYRDVKKAADLLGIVRDTDVMTQHVGDLLQQAAGEEIAGMHWLIERLSAYRKEQQQVLENYLQSAGEKTIQDKIKSCIPKGVSSNGQS